jgi:hypothetical protein
MNESEPELTEMEKLQREKDELKTEIEMLKERHRTENNIYCVRSQFQSQLRKFQLITHHLIDEFCKKNNADDPLTFTDFVRNPKYKEMLNELCINMFDLEPVITVDAVDDNVKAPEDGAFFLWRHIG